MWKLRDETQKSVKEKIEKWELRRDLLRREMISKKVKNEYSEVKGKKKHGMWEVFKC